MRPTTPSQRTLRMLFWETTIRCNLACAHCRRLESNETSDADLSTTQAHSLLEQLAELGRRQPQMPVLVFSGGEPLCREDLFDLIGAAKGYGIIPALATNGTTITAEIAQQIRDHGVGRVSVSLDGATADVHDRMRQIPGAFDRAIEGIRHLRECGVPFQINVTMTRQNVRQLHQVYDLAKSLGAMAVHLFMLVPVGCGETLAETDMLAPAQYEQVMREIWAVESRGEIQIKVTCGPHYERVKRQLVAAQGGSVKAEGLTDGSRGWQKDHRPKVLGDVVRPPHSGHGAVSKGCLAGLGVLFVSHRGDVYPCGYLPVDCGNVLRQRLVEIWDTSEDLARMRDTTALEGKCGLCGYKQVCGGCRGRAFAATGNYLAEEPFCAYFPPAAQGRTG
jgi:AdoMet-dependent heme synthase